MTRRTLFWMFVALQALVPVAVAGLREADVAFGKHVLLRAEPVDPRDPFRGQYVALTYPISRLDNSSYADGQTLYVRLHRDGEAWTGEPATPSKPRSGTYIRGRVHDGRIEFGIERFYASERDAERYGAALLDRRVYADVALGVNGRATLRRLVIR